MAQYQHEVLDCDRVTAALPGYQKWYRFTYLREGNTPEKRNGMRKFLRQQGYRNGYVRLDTSDWRPNEKLSGVLAKDPQANVEPIRQAYPAQRLRGRNIPQVLLLHHNLINATWLDDVIRQFKEMGRTITTPAQACADPVYRCMPQRSGGMLLPAMEPSLGLPPAELGCA